jgi:hypothetical protein
MFQPASSSRQNKATLSVISNQSSNETLSASIWKTSSLSTIDEGVMFKLYDLYYDGAEPATFRRDLSAKDYVIVLRDAANVVRGFSTLALYSEEYEGGKVNVVYSGDTIIDQQYWGQNQFSKIWLQFAGQIKRDDPKTPLYWLLIVKGHRTYRYLSLFSSEYFPRYDCVTPSEFEKLMDHLASRRFGSAWDSTRGLVLFPEPRSFLNGDLAIVPEKDRKRPEVEYFLRRNPSYAQGDELLCLCELKAEKLNRIARRWFLEGYSEPVQ